VLESIVAIFILSLSVSGIFTAVQQSLFQATAARDEVTAFYLAQEAVEVVRNRRDTNQLARINGGTNSWLDGITQGTLPNYCPFSITAGTRNTCTVDATNLQISYCDDSDWGVCPVLKQDPTTFVYSYAGDDTKFVREIQIESINANEIAVIVRISWTEGLISQEFKAKTLLFNWVQTPT